MGKMPIGSSVEPEIRDLLDRLTNELGPPKNRILESAIEIFSVLPKELQLILKSNRHEDRRLILDLIGAIKVPFPQDKVGSKKKTAK